MSKAYEVANEQDQIVIRFDSKIVDQNALSRVLDYLELESLRSRSRMTEAEASELAEEIDQAVWEQVKHKYTGE
ncbi:MAG TPA: hypothetical protein VMW27_25235 [Thermoanaerobaculia bacterium]|nr:hypothetical protein [Thermoanaerobaculia bacterium]